MYTTELRTLFPSIFLSTTFGPKSVTHVSGTFCYLCLGTDTFPPIGMSRVSDKPYFVYVLWSPSGQCFYVGISDDPSDREDQYNSGRFKSWSKRHRPWTLVFTEKHPSYSSARKHEIQLKAQKGGTGFFLKTGLDPKFFGR